MNELTERQERRRNRRVNFRAPCTVGVAGLAVRAECINLSLGGVLARVHMADAIRLRERDVCVFDLPANGVNGQRMEIVSRVARKSSNCVGLEFQTMSLESLTELRNFLACNGGEEFDCTDELRALGEKRLTPADSSAS